MRKDIGEFLLANALGGEYGNSKGHTVTAMRDMVKKSFGVELENDDIKAFLARHGAKPVSLQSEIDSRALADYWSYAKHLKTAKIRVCKNCGARFTIIKGDKSRELCNACYERTKHGNRQSKVIIRSDGVIYVSQRIAALENDCAQGTIKHAIDTGNTINGFTFKLKEKG